ncbi:MAG TPA: ATP-binding protein [Candidatus Olsenella avicola]|nr:ATP-binding protein [Candidatus Olsenella avicola]
MKNELVNRPVYLDWLNRWKDRDVIKVATGLRRCGKSRVLELFRRQLREGGVADSNILGINFESWDEEYPLDARELYRYIVQRLGSGTNYVFLDEVQHVKEFERAVDALYVREDVDLYITGSNAFFLSGELATLLTGRYVELRMLPFSFAEYRSARGGEENLEDAFNRYLTYGGMPFAARLDDPQSIADYLGGVFNTVLVEDVARRHPRMDMRAFRDLSAFIADNVGNITSRKRLAAGLAQAGTKVSPATIGAYLDALMENYLAFKAGRYDLKGREYLETLEKYYLGDLGFRFWLLGKEQGDLGRRLENAVYLELLRRYRTVCVGKVGTAEVDFIGMGQDGPEYYQVAQTVLDEATRNREFAPLEAIADNYPKTVLTLDRVGVGDYRGIHHLNVIDWMLGE